jgi:metallophosphoesterase superfamily enzyme
VKRHQAELRTDGAQVVVDHLTQCTDADAAIVVDGNADPEIAQLLAAGWTIEERVDFVAGKRIRFLHPPASDSPESVFRALRGDDHGR